VDVEYDCLLEQVYYTDVVAGYIGRIDTNSPGHNVLYHDLQYPEGEKIYFFKDKNSIIQSLADAEILSKEDYI